MSLTYKKIIGIAIASALVVVVGYFECTPHIVQSNSKPVLSTAPSPFPVAQTAVSLPSQTSAINVPILMYHYVEHVKDKRDTIRQSLDILPETLDSQLSTLQANGYTFMYASELADVIDGKESLPSKPIVLTFDDGYGDFYTDALPILEKHHVKSTAYIISGFINKPNYMTTKQLEEVQQSGIVEIGAHTQHHIDLQKASIQKATQEIDGSRTDLQNWLHAPVLSFAYPGGRFSANTIKVVQQAGFSTAVSTLPGTTASNTNRFVLYRLRAGSRTGARLVAFLNSKISIASAQQKQSAHLAKRV